MTKQMKLCQILFALVLVVSLTLGLCANGFSVFAAENDDVESRKDAILKEFFGDGVTTEEAFDKLLAETDKMESYVNQSFCYVPNSNSYYVALGDEVVAGTSRQKTTYVDMLADALGISCKNLSKAQMAIQDVYATISDNSSEIAKADLITIGWNNYSATYRMCQYMGEKNPVKVSDELWEALVGEENMPLLEDLLDQMFKKLRDENLSTFAGFDIEGGLEWYAYTYMSNAIHQSQLIEAIRIINPSAAIILVGTYNDLEGISLSANNSVMDLGDMMEDLVNASNLLATKNAAAYKRVAFVNCPDVSTTLDDKASGYTTPQQYVLAIVGRQGLPNADGYAYIANQIKNAMSDTCGHIWDEGTVTTNPTCGKDGVMTYVCTWCDETKTESIPATGEHTWDEGVVTKNPTATEDGEKTYTCKDCGTTKTEVIEKTGEPEAKLGDVNSDGRVNTRDARLLLLYVAGLADEGAVNTNVADVTNDGRINVRDARTLLNMVVGS